MARIITFFLALGFALLATVARAQDEDMSPLRTHSIYMPYIDQDLQNRWFDFGGDAVINTNKYIRLTSDSPSQTGYLWSRLPITAPNFQIEFEFKISGVSDSLSGDGFAMFLTREHSMMGPVFGNRDFFTGVGIFFDTYANSRQVYNFPYVMAMVGDGKTSYDHHQDGNANSLGGCEAEIRGNEMPTKARVIYSRESKRLVLKLQTKAWDQWEDCFSLNDIELPPLAYLGFTAATGEVHDNHDIVSVTTNTMNHGLEKTARQQRANNTPPPGRRTAFAWYLKFLAGCVVFVALFMVFRMTRSQNNMKHF